MGRKNKKKKAKVTSELPPPKPVTDNDNDNDDDEEEEEEEDDYSNYAHELLFGTNEFYDAKEKRKEERRKAMIKKKEEAEEEKEKRKKEENNKNKEEVEKGKQEEDKKTNQEGVEKGKKEENNKKVSPKSKRKTNRQCKELFGRTTRVRIPDDCLFKYFELNNVLGFTNDGDTIAWLMDKAQPAVHGVLGLPSEQDNKDETWVQNTNSTSSDLDALQLLKKFQVNQVWALWDDDVDGMPRLYARIHKLLFDELKVEVAFLEPVRTNDQEIRWLTDKPMACGTFKEAALTTSMEILGFSHQVNCGKGSSMEKASYKISPQKGEIWAVYKDWDINWTLHDFSHCRYKIVEVVSDLGDESVITAICLTRIDGAGDVFRRQVHGRDGLVKWQQFSETQLLQFSHRILASKLKVQEMDSVPVESWKLDSAAVPLHFHPGR